MPNVNPTSIEPDAFAILLDRAQGIADQQAEANVARRARDERALQITRENMSAAQRNATEAARSANQQAALLADSQAKLDRIDEINNDPLLWLAEPVMGLINEQYSRPRLQNKVAQNAQRITIQRQQDQVAAESVVARQQAQQAELLSLDMQVALESGDVDAIEKMVAQTKAAQNDALLFKQMLLAKTPDKDLARLPSFMDFTSREIEAEKNVRVTEGYQQRMQVYSELGAVYDKQQRDVQQLTPEQLRDPRVLAQFPAQAIYTERNRREMQQISNDMARRANDLETLSKQELAAKGVRRQGGQTPTSASLAIKSRVQADEDRVLAAEDRELRREDQAMRREDQAMRRQAFADEQADRPEKREHERTARQMEIERLRAGSAELALSTATVADKYNWAVAAQQTGGVYDFGDGRKLPLGKIMDSIKLDEALRAETVINGSIGNIADVAVKSAVTTTMRAAGIQFDDRMDTTTALQSVIDSPTAPQELRQQAAIVQQGLTAVRDPRTGATMQALLGERLAESARELRKIAVDNAVATVPRSIEPIVRKYYETNTIASVTDASLLIADAAANNTSTGRWYYDRATHEAKSFMVAPAVDTEDVSQLLIAREAQISPVDRLFTALGEETTEQTLAAPIIDGALMQTAQAVAANAGYSDIAVAIATNEPAVLDENAAFSLQKIVLAVQEKHGAEAAMAFRSSLLQQGREHIVAATTPTSYTMAAYNKQLFNDDAVGAIYNELVMRLGTEKETERLLFKQRTNNQIRKAQRSLPDQVGFGLSRYIIEPILNIVP